MLVRLSVKNLTVFEDELIELGGGLSVITGETGAGKTMLLAALGLIGGEKPSGPSMIGPDSDRARVEAEFDAETPSALRELLSEAREEGEPLVLARELSRGKPARAFACGVGCSAAQLREAKTELLSLTGQHAARKLTSHSYQLGLIDSALTPEGLRSRERVARLYGEWTAASAALSELQGDASEKARRAEMLRHESQLFESLDPADDELGELEAEAALLENAVQIASAASEGQAKLADEILSELDRLTVLCEESGAGPLREQAERISSAREELSDVASELARMSLSEADPARLDQLNIRVAEIADLRRRFGGLSVAEIRAQIAGAAEELRVLENLEEEIETRRAAEAAAERAYNASASELTSHRERAAGAWKERVESELSELALGEAELEIELSEAAPSASGRDQLGISLRANAGLEPAPLGRGASGGELSRVHLAVVLASIWGRREAAAGGGAAGAASGSEPVYLFDEVDAGIGGMTAHSVAAALKKLAESGSQVIVVTHLSQIARLADDHFVVEKTTSAGRTKTTLRKLTDADSTHAELARLVGLEGVEAGELLAEA